MSAFVGRRDELAELGEITGAAAAGHVSAAVVVGEPGSGKSRLLAEAALRAPLSNRFRVVGYEPEREVPLTAASDLLLAIAAKAPAAHGLETLLFGRCGSSSPCTAHFARSVRRWFSSTTCNGSTSSRSRFAIISCEPPVTAASRLH